MDYNKSIDSVEKSTDVSGIKDVLDVLLELEEGYYNVVNSSATQEKKIDTVKRFSKETFGDIYASIANLNPDGVKSLAETLSAKNADYGNSFDRGIELYGATGMTLRISDKVHRMQTLMRSANTPRVDESLQDTLVDILGYLVLTFTYKEEGR